MSAIIRCSKCLSTVFADATHCHSCGVELQPRTAHRLIGRRGWIFVLAAVGLFVIGDSIYWLNQRRNIYHGDGEGRQSARVFVQAFLRQDTEAMEDLLIHDLLRSPKVLKKTIESETAAISALLPVDAVESIELLSAGIVNEHTHYSRPGRTLHRHPARRYYYEARVVKGGAVHVLRGQVCVNGKSGTQRIICFRLDSVEHHGPEDSWSAVLTSPEIEHLRARSEYPPNHEPRPAAGR